MLIRHHKIKNIKEEFSGKPENWREGIALLISEMCNSIHAYMFRTQGGIFESC
jgi:hypothetical protein